MTILIEDGWSFNSADFSVQAKTDQRSKGNVTLVRDMEQQLLWHKVIDNIEDEDDWPKLYVTATGMTIEEAILNANFKARYAQPLVE